MSSPGFGGSSHDWSPDVGGPIWVATRGVQMGCQVNCCATPFRGCSQAPGKRVRAAGLGARNPRRPESAMHAVGDGRSFLREIVGVRASKGAGEGICLVFINEAVRLSFGSIHPVTLAIGTGVEFTCITTGPTWTNSVEDPEPGLRAERPSDPVPPGLQYLHTRNPVVVHRDIKSANVSPGSAGTATTARKGDVWGRHTAWGAHSNAPMFGWRLATLEGPSFAILRGC